MIDLRGEESKLKLAQRYSDILSRWARTKAEIRAIAIFGSLAQGAFHNESDLDLLIDFAEGEHDSVESQEVVLRMDWSDELSALLMRKVDVHFPSRPNAKRFAAIAYRTAYDPHAVLESILGIEGKRQW